MKNLDRYEDDWMLCVLGIFGEKCPEEYGMFWKKYWNRLWKKDRNQ